MSGWKESSSFRNHEKTKIEKNQITNQQHQCKSEKSKTLFFFENYIKKKFSY